MSTAPLVSVVIATYNRARVLAHAIQSVRRSTLTDWASAVAHLESTRADLVWSPLLVALPASAAELAAGTRRFRLSGVVDGDDYDPRAFVFASAWLLTRELATRVGPWRAAHETFVSSSQDWLFRAWRSGARLCFHGNVGVLALPAGARAGSYAAAESPSTITTRQRCATIHASGTQRWPSRRSPASVRPIASG